MENEKVRYVELRYVELTDHQYEEYRESFRSTKDSRILLHKMLVDMIGEMARRDDSNSSWDAIARLCGFQSRADSDEQGFELRLEWDRRRIAVLPREDNDA